MPSIMYTEDEHSSQAPQNGPEEPIRYNPYGAPQSGGPQGQGGPTIAEYQSTKRMITVAQVCSVVSLFIGGVLLSGAMIIVSAIAWRRTSTTCAALEEGRDLVTWELLGRSAKIALAMSILAFALNAVSLAIVYPIVIEMLQTGDYAQMLGAASSTSSSSSVWG